MNAVGRPVSAALCGLGWLALAACAVRMSTSRPADFALVYEWQEGSLPPPYHYSYLITLAPEAPGRLAYTPDYGFADPPTWIETFPVAEADWDQLYRLVQAAGVFDAAWEPVPLPPVGGEQAWLTVTAAGQSYTVPAVLSEADQARVAELYAAVTALAPRALWERLNAQREAYMAGRP